ncbi:class I SAM-dependent methyltransferase [Pseudobacter ginsenosidimutans]|uniref:Methyltransferase family protein n=1 Tax=Pseudobacter ginsenosidimutans TaxID=661488 RepID=A0A4Q7MSK2_9BACT|nr:class I SAM-dependent methyltransferase [Pseudobacter ginsenosidimutans]QEC41423.1 methyltransferase domain-containing protein [Pseudobacter ginsenosidimutans]RZS71796.1 methyltransferase family protein [Pseudobacter ginsenosidimutans]
MAKEIIIPAVNRFEWAAAIIAPAADDHILEIGCGAGLLAELITASLHKGKLTAIDSSASMIRKAEKRNQAAISNGKLSLLTKSFAEARFRQPFNKFVAFNVNFFWKNTEDELALIQKLLTAHGKLFVFYQTPSGIDLQLKKKIEDMLTSNGFKIYRSLVENKEPVRSFALIATVH